MGSLDTGCTITRAGRASVLFFRMSEMEKWESIARRVKYNLHKGYTIHNQWVRQRGQYDKVVYDVDGKELTLRQIYDRDESQLTFYQDAR